MSGRDVAVRIAWVVGGLFAMAAGAVVFGTELGMLASECKWHRALVAAFGPDYVKQGVPGAAHWASGAVQHSIVTKANEVLAKAAATATATVAS